MRLLVCALSMLVALGSSAAGFADDAAEAEQRIIKYIKENLKPGEPLIVSKLYNEVFTEPAERAALNKLNGAFFRIPLFIVEIQSTQNRLASLEEIAGQFDFYGPEEADVVLSIMESDPRVPDFLDRDAESGEILAIDIDKVKGDARFNQAVERTLTGWEGKMLPEVKGIAFDGKEMSASDLDSKALLIYVWFTNCPPCVKIGPELVALQEKYQEQRFHVLGLNADKVLKLNYTDADRSAYAQKVGTNYSNLFLTDDLRASLGNVNIFPTLFLVDGSGRIVKHFVNFQSRDTLGPEIERILEMSPSEDR